VSEYLIGLDLGTSALKAGLFTRTGALLNMQRESYALYSPRPGWAEQEPLDWWAAAVRALRALTADVSPAQIAAVGLAGQCPSHVLVDGRGEPLGRAIIWRDQRAVAEAEWIAARISPEQARAWTGSDHLGDAALPPARLRWLRAHRPEDWRRTRAILQPKDFLALRLTGEWATDRTSTFCLTSPADGRYCPEFFEMLEVPLEIMPPVLPALAVVGRVTPEAAQTTGLAAGTSVVIGTIDAHCEIIGGGGLVPGRAVDVAGTSEIVAISAAHHVSGGGVYATAVAEDAQFVCGPMQMGTEALRWLGRAFFAEGADGAGFAALEVEAALAPPGSQALIFLPYLDGERAPIWDARARGAFVGLTSAHGRAHCARAVYEGVAFAVRHVLEACEAAGRTQAEAVSVCGGGSRSAFWNQIKADVLNRPVWPAALAEAACLGAVMLAGVGVGLYGGLAEAAGAMARFGQPLAPRAGAAELYDRLFAVYRGLYPALGPSFRALAES
jgi:xylulokinase